MSIQADLEHGLRLMLLVDETAKVLQQRLLSNLCTTSAAFHTTLKTIPIKNTLTQLHRKRVITKDQYKLLYPTAHRTADVNKLDSTLLFVLLLNIGPTHKIVSDKPHIEKLRKLRNKIIHSPLATPQRIFQQIWVDVCAELCHLGAIPAALSALQSTEIDNTLATSLQKLKRDLRKSQVAGCGAVITTCGIFLFVALSLCYNYKSLQVQYRRLLKAGEEGIWYRVPEYTNNFIVREGYANNITDTIKSVVSNNTRLGILLHGIGGVGKTELAIDFCRKHSGDFAGNVMWIDFESRSSADNSFRDLASELQIGIVDKTIDFIIQQIYQFLSDKKSIFVFDNVSPATNIASYLPKLSPKSFTPVILMTSQWDLLHLGNKFERKCIDVFDKETAERFVKGQLSNLLPDIPFTINDVTSLVESVDGLPLALQQSVSYIIRYRLTIAQYLIQFKRDFGKLDVALNNQYEKTVLTTLKISLESLSNTTLDCAPVAIDVMYISACLFSTKVSLELLRNMQMEDVFDIDRAVNLLAQQSLIKHIRYNNDSYIAMHNITRVGIRVLMKSNLKYFHYCKVSVSLIERCSTHQDALRMHYRYGDHWVVHLEEFLKDNEDLDTLMLLKPLLPLITQAFENKRQFESCSNFFQTLRRKVTSIGIDTEYLKIKTEYINVIELRLLFCLLAQNTSKDVINLYQDLRNSSLSNIHSSTDGRFTSTVFFLFMDTLLDLEGKKSKNKGSLSKWGWFNVSMILCKMFKCEFELFSEIFRGAMVNDEMTLSVFRYHFGIAVYKKTSDSLGRCRELFHACRNPYPNEKDKEMNSDIVEYGENEDYEQRQKKWETNTLEAERLSKEVLPHEIEELGNDHKKTRSTKLLISELLKDYPGLTIPSNRKERERLLNEVLSSETMVLGNNHEETQKTKIRLAKLLESNDEIEKALNLLKDFNTWSCEVWKLWVWWTWLVIFRSTFDLVERDLGEQEVEWRYIFGWESIRLFGEVLNSEAVEFGENHNQAQSLKIITAKISEKRGDLAEALRLLNEVLSAQKIELSNDHEETLKTKIRIAELLEKEGDRKGALKLLTEVLISETKELGEDHTKTQNTKTKITKIIEGESFSNTFSLFILLSVVFLSLVICGIVYIFSKYRQSKIKDD